MKQENIILNINKPFIQLTMKANGKADLYFHAYFWEKYLKQISDSGSGGSASGSKSARKKKQILKKPDDEEQDPGSGPAEEEVSETPIATGGKVDLFSGKYPFMKRLIGLSATLSKVIVNIKKFPFHEKMYHKYAKEFGQRQTSKKMKYLEEIQRALFVAQIADDKNGLYWIEKLLIQLQGYCDIGIRDQAIVLLNMLYDGVDW